MAISVLSGTNSLLLLPSGTYTQATSPAGLSQTASAGDQFYSKLGVQEIIRNLISNTGGSIGRHFATGPGAHFSVLGPSTLCPWSSK